MPQTFRLLALSLIALVTLGQASAAQSPNVLFIAIDDLKTIGSIYSEEPGNFLARVYPNDAMRKAVANRMTPNLKRLSDQAVTFMDAYCAAPACNPSRAAILTGIHPSTSGLTTNAGGVFFRNYKYEGKRPLANATTLPELLKSNGWYTAATGKILHTANSFEKSDGHRSWTAWCGVTGGAGKKVRSKQSPKSLDWGVEGNRSVTYRQLNDYRRADFVASVLETGQGKADSGDEFKLPSDKPFFLACGIFRPHLPFYSTNDLIDLFPTEEMTVTREMLDEFTEDADDVPAEAFKMSGLSLGKNGKPAIGKDRFVDVLNHGKKGGREDGDLAAWKDMLRHYFASVAIADRAVGRLLDGLAASKYADNTMVILWSDHGYHMGEKLHVSKFTFWDDGANVNFIVKDPRHPESHGKRCDRPVTLTDIFPTVAKIAGVELPDQRIYGHDLTPLLKDPAAEWSHPALTTYRRVTDNMIRSKEFKLIRYGDDNGQVELYNLQSDPEEITNLADDAQYEETKKQLLDQLDESLSQRR